MSKLTTHNDEPVLETAFQPDFIRRLCKIIQTCQPPKGLAVTGYWGSGKTSALKQLYYHLSGDLPPGCIAKPPIDALYKDTSLVPIWFEAWRFQHETQPIVALLNEIRVKIGLLHHLTDKAKLLSHVAVLGSLTLFDEIIKTASAGLMQPNLSGLSAVGEQWEKERYLNKLPSAELAGLLEEAIQKAIGKKKRLLIFIDDLDRCLPTASLRLLEGIRIYLNLRNCIVVFGMDQRQLEQSLMQALPGLDKDKDQKYFASEYLEKICQDIHPLPLPDKQDKAAYFLKLLEALSFDETACQQIGTILKKFDCLPANPRKIKALVNRVALTLREVPPESGPTIKTRQYKLLLATAIIATFHKELYEQLESSPQYINAVYEYNRADAVQRTDFKPLAALIPSRVWGKSLPVNPSDSNVFRLHELLDDLKAITEEELTPYLRLRR